MKPLQAREVQFRTILTPEDCNKRILQGMSDYNATARRRYLKATAFGERFTATIEPLSLGSQDAGTFMRHFAVEAVGVYSPRRDGTVEVTIGFRWSLSLFQIVWRLLFVGLLALIAWSFVNGIIVARALAFALLLGPVVLPWATIAYFQGMRQAGRDWTDLMHYLGTSLAYHTSI